MPKGHYDRNKSKAHIEPGENSRMVTNALLGLKKPRVDVKDPQAIAERMEEYLNYCIENDISPSVAGCANWLGVHIDTVSAWYSGRRGSPEHQRTASNFYGVLQDIWAQKMDNGSINPVSGIFMGKAFYGYKDTQEIVVTHNNNQEMSVADLIAESKRLPGAETMSLPQNEATQNTIDADFRVLEDDKRYERAVEKKERIEARLIPPEERPARARQKSKKYYDNHKEKVIQNVLNYQAKKRAEKRADKAQKANDADETGQITLNFDD